MTAPSLSHSRTNAHLFAEFVQKYTGSVYSLSSILTESSVKAEEVSIHTFAELHKSFRQDRFNPQLGPIQAYQICIRECYAFLESCTSSSEIMLCPADKVLCALRFGLKLPLSEISAVLEETPPALKAKLRRVREKMNGEIKHSYLNSTHVIV
ncbi:sigma-70 family RNA polymerase sigma factor [Paenibacillus wynnii]|uniref:RNA polymerase sigma factor 70 region 4 type 2 domain-containing protein n=1 Tax=Paenibacillus wynnii TaxID=268407 RepID=A0A098MBV1_9BACL|nr:sigma-70 family RNA polymerase sigma factor [Paenibacillus wynnii]KGE19533.1 hypothetical protein PWYN_09410 [Paenibacillus wynnii]